MAEWDTSKVEGEMLELEVAQAWLILSPSGWDLPDPEASEPMPEESQVVSFVPFHLIGFGVPAHHSREGSFATSGYEFVT
jgi:hypothetical protein